MLPVEIMYSHGAVVLRARNSELLILPQHVKALHSLKKPLEFSSYFMKEALVNRPARKLFEAWLRKDKEVWPKLFKTIKEKYSEDDFKAEHQELPEEGSGTVSQDATEPKAAEKEKTAEPKVAEKEKTAEPKVAEKEKTAEPKVAEKEKTSEPKAAEETSEAQESKSVEKKAIKKKVSKKKVAAVASEANIGKASGSKKAGTKKSSTAKKTSTEKKKASTKKSSVSKKKTSSGA